MSDSFTRHRDRTLTLATHALAQLQYRILERVDLLCPKHNLMRLSDKCGEVYAAQMLQHAICADEVTCPLPLDMMELLFSVLDHVRTTHGEHWKLACEIVQDPDVRALSDQYSRFSDEAERISTRGGDHSSW